MVRKEKLDAKAWMKTTRERRERKLVPETLILVYTGFPGVASWKEPACRCRGCNRRRFNPWVGKISWRRQWQPTLVVLPGKSHGQRNLVRLQSMGSQRVGHDWVTSLKEKNTQKSKQFFHVQDLNSQLKKKVLYKSLSIDVFSNLLSTNLRWSFCRNSIKMRKNNHLLKAKCEPGNYEIINTNFCDLSMPPSQESLL